MTSLPEAPALTWYPVCPLGDLLPGRGAGALIGGEQAALFRLPSGEVYAVGNYDPYGRANVIARGIAGSKGGTPTVTSPLYKHVFDLRTGQCCDDPGGPGLASWPVRIAGGTVEIGLA
jgi:nitrite reductase (NADH) small subunit